MTDQEGERQRANSTPTSDLTLIVAPELSTDVCFLVNGMPRKAVPEMSLPGCAGSACYARDAIGEIPPGVKFRREPSSFDHSARLSSKQP